MRKVEVKQIYRHFKGDYYLVEDIGYDCETAKECVIYRALYGDGKLWIRPLEDFLKEIDYEKYPEAKETYRFELQEIKSKRVK